MTIIDKTLAPLKSPWDGTEQVDRGSPQKWMVRVKVWRGQFGWRYGRAGEPIHDTVAHFFSSKRAALKFMRAQGCTCCAMPPARPVVGHWYRAGYGDAVQLRKERPTGPARSDGWYTKQAVKKAEAGK